MLSASAFCFIIYVFLGRSSDLRNGLNPNSIAYRFQVYLCKGDFYQKIVKNFTKCHGLKILTKGIIISLGFFLWLKCLWVVSANKFRETEREILISRFDFRNPTGYQLLYIQQKMTKEAFCHTQRYFSFPRCNRLAAERSLSWPWPSISFSIVELLHYFSSSRLDSIGYRH